MSDLATCPHDRGTFVREPGVSSYKCPECRARVCLDCRRFGTRHGSSLVDWSTGICGDCYSKREQRLNAEASLRKARDRREALQAAWDAGHAAPADAPNPHAVPSDEEAWLVERHPWLREGKQ